MAERATRPQDSAPTPLVPGRPANRYTYRRFLFLSAEDALSCPFGHRQDDGLTFGAGGAFRCRHQQPGSGDGDCSALFLLVGHRFQSRDGDAVLMLLQVMPHEMKEVTKRRLCADCALVYLGAFSRRGKGERLELACVHCAAIRAGRPAPLPGELLAGR